MAELDQLLITLQHSDSVFPSGALSFSWGLEQLASDGVVASVDVAAGGTFERDARLISFEAPPPSDDAE